MPYVPVSVNVYCAAFSGMMGALAAARQTTDNVAADYDHDTKVSGAFAAAFDTALNDATPNVLQLGEIESIIGELFYTAFPTGAGSESKTATNYVALAGAVVARLAQADAFVAGEGIVPPGVPTNPEISFAQTRFVAKNGSDATGDGSMGAPFLTIQAAITSITDAVAAKVYGVIVMPGTYAETFAVSPFVYVMGFNKSACILTNATANWITAGFAAGTQDGGIGNFTLRSALVVDFSLVASAGAATFKLWSLWLDTGATMLMKGNNVNNIGHLDDISCLVSGTNITITNMGQMTGNAIFGRQSTLLLNGADTYTQTYRLGNMGGFNTVTSTWTGAVTANFLSVTYAGMSPNVASFTCVGTACFVSALGMPIAVVVPDADTTYGFGNTNPVGATILPSGGRVQATIIATADRTITFAAALGDTWFLLKNNSLFFITLAFSVGGGNPNGQTYIGPNGFVLMFYQGGTGWCNDNKLQSGKVTLSNGESALIPADITAQSSIVATLNDINGSATTGPIVVAKPGNRVVGTRAGGGGFKITGTTGAGVTNATDQGIYDWQVTRP